MDPPEMPSVEVALFDLRQVELWTGSDALHAENPRRPGMRTKNRCLAERVGSECVHLLS
jgi:hypothetical protein